LEKFKKGLKMKKGSIMLILLVCCCFIPNVRAIEKTEETFLWHTWDPSSYSFSFAHFPEKLNVISWSFETFDDPFEVSTGFWEDNIQWVSTSKTKDSGVVSSTRDSFAFIFARDEQIIEGYIRILLENFTILSYPFFLILGVIGTTILIGVIGLKKKRN
jgi:hypothetical protein